MVQLVVPDPFEMCPVVIYRRLHVYVGNVTQVLASNVRSTPWGVILVLSTSVFRMLCMYIDPRASGVMLLLSRLPCLLGIPGINSYPGVLSIEVNSKQEKKIE